MGVGGCGGVVFFSGRGLTEPGLNCLFEALRPTEKGSLTMRHRPGFTLVEILIVVVILGILAAIVIPQFTSAAEDAKKVVFITDLREFNKAAIRYRFDTDEYLEDASSGVLPSGWAPYLDESKWVNGTPIGGVWDMESFGEGGYAQALGVHFDGTGQTRDDDYMLEIDGAFDDNALSTGVFREIVNDQRYYYIVAE